MGLQAAQAPQHWSQIKNIPVQKWSEIHNGTDVHITWLDLVA
jgi:hypothetical protein